MMSLEIISGKAQSSDEPSQENCLLIGHRWYPQRMGRGLWAEAQAFLFHGSSIGGAGSAAFFSLVGSGQASCVGGGERSLVEIADEISDIAKGDFL